MNLGQIKEALAKFNQDMDSAEVFFLYAANGQRHVDMTCGVGIIPIDDTAHIAIVGLTEMERVKQATGELPKAGDKMSAGEPPCIEGDEWKHSD